MNLETQVEKINHRTATVGAIEMYVRGESAKYDVFLSACMVAAITGINQYTNLNTNSELPLAVIYAGGSLFAVNGLVDATAAYLISRRLTKNSKIPDVK